MLKNNPKTKHLTHPHTKTRGHGYHHWHWLQAAPIALHSKFQQAAQ